MSEGITTLTDAEFKAQVLDNSTPTLVDFWAEWCGPCKALAPIVKQVADAYEGRLQVGKMDIDQYPNTAGQYGIRSIPTLLLFKDGQVVEQLVGLVPKAKLDEVLARHL